MSAKKTAPDTFTAPAQDGPGAPTVPQDGAAPPSAGITPPARKRGAKSEVDSLAGLSFAPKAALPPRRQALDPKRLEAAREFATQAMQGAAASDGVKYATQHAAYLAAMVYRRLLELGFRMVNVAAVEGATVQTAEKAGWKARTRIVQNGAEDFAWSVYGDAPGEGETETPEADTTETPETPAENVSA